jgi:predicted RNase H-like HicB family nuclease
MEIPVLLERIEGNGYRARGVEPFGITTEGATKDEALRKLRELLTARLKSGSEITTITIPEQDNPWLRVCGTLDPNDPLVQEWEEIMKENRRKADEDPDY